MTIEQAKQHFENIGIKEGDELRCAFVDSDKAVFGSWEWSELEVVDDGSVLTKNCVAKYDEDFGYYSNHLWLYHARTNKFATPVNQESELDFLLNNFQTQGTEDWHGVRVGKFTSSVIYKLLTSSRKKDEVFGDTSKSYIYEKAAERLSGVSCDNFDGNDATRWGEEHEDEAAKEFERVTGLKTALASFISSTPYSGGSIDRWVGKDKKAIAEIKCPYNSANFMKVVDGYVDPKYYAQMQHNMLVTKTDKCYYINYDPRMPEGKRLTYKIIERDAEFIANLEERIKLANKEVDRILGLV